MFLRYMHTIDKALKPGSAYFASVTELERATQFLAREIGELEELLMDSLEEVRWSLNFSNADDMYSNIDQCCYCFAWC